MSLYSAIEENARLRPRRTAILIGPPARAVSFAEWWERSATLAASLPEGDGYLACRLREASELPFALLAAWMRGLALLPLPPSLTGPEREALLAECGLPAAEWHGLPEGAGSAGPARFYGARRAALLLATSGSTATPKVFEFTHEELLAGGRLGLAQLAPGAGANVLNLRPAFTSGGTNTLWPAMLSGATLSYAHGAFGLPRREALAALLAELRPSLLVASPAWLRAFCREEGDGPPVAKEMPLFYGGLRLRASEHARLCALGFLPVMRYGMTECAHVLSSVPFTESGEPAPGYVGAPAEGLDARAENGKLLFRGPGFASRLLQGGKPVPCLEEGFYRSDDTGSVRAEGIFLEGREHAPISVAGFRVAAAEVEECLMASGLLADCAVAGIKDPLWGEKVAALVVPAPGAKEALARELRAWCRGRISAHKVPARVSKATALPLMANGKIDRRAVSERLERAAEAEREGEREAD